MHIVIAILTALGTLAWALYRLHDSGVNLNAFNPFYWLRRRQWAKQVGTKPLHRLTNPMEAAAVLVVGMAELDGVVTREHKQEIITLFSTEFGIDDAAAAELYAASSYLLKDVVSLDTEVKNILAPSKALYEERHKTSLLHMLKTISEAESPANQNQQAVLLAVEKQFVPDKATPTKW